MKKQQRQYKQQPGGGEGLDGAENTGVGSGQQETGAASNEVKSSPANARVDEYRNRNSTGFETATSTGLNEKSEEDARTGSQAENRGKAKDAGQQ